MESPSYKRPLRLLFMRNKILRSANAKYHYIDLVGVLGVVIQYCVTPKITAKKPD